MTAGVAAGPLRALVALGGNLGDPYATLAAAAREVAALGALEGGSSLYRTEPVGGPPGQPPYLNAVIALWPAPSFRAPDALLTALLAIERAHGRERRDRWAARTLDLDLLDLDGMVHDGPQVSLPHPRMMERGFVLAPLCELTPGWRHPVTGEGACEALARVGAGGVVRTSASWLPR